MSDAAALASCLVWCGVACTHGHPAWTWAVWCWRCLSGARKVAPCLAAPPMDRSPKLSRPTPEGGPEGSASTARQTSGRGEMSSSASSGKRFHHGCTGRFRSVRCPNEVRRCVPSRRCSVGAHAAMLPCLASASACASRQDDLRIAPWLVYIAVCSKQYTMANFVEKGFCGKGG